MLTNSFTTPEPVEYFAAHPAPALPTNIKIQIFTTLISKPNLSRLELHALLNTSHSSISKAIMQLSDRSLITETISLRDPAKNGRPAQKISINQDYGVLVGIVHTNTELKLTFRDIAGTFLHGARIDISLMPRFLKDPAAVLSMWLFSEHAKLGAQTKLPIVSVGIVSTTLDAQKIATTLNEFQSKRDTHLDTYTEYLPEEQAITPHNRHQRIAVNVMSPSHAWVSFEKFARLGFPLAEHEKITQTHEDTLYHSPSDPLGITYTQGKAIIENRKILHTLEKNSSHFKESYPADSLTPVPLGYLDMASDIIETTAITSVEDNKNFYRGLSIGASYDFFLATQMV